MDAGPSDAHAADAAGTKTMLDKGVTLSKADDSMTAAITEKLEGVNAGFMEAAKAAGIDGQAAMDMLKAEVAAAK